MAHLLIVTDHRFYKFKEDVFDNYVFDYNYFKDYLDVFDKVTVLSRMIELEQNTTGKLIKSSGININFISLGNLSGINWLLKSKHVINTNMKAIEATDAICMRIPSIAAYRMIDRVHELPIIFELVGDPVASLFSPSDRFLKKIVLMLIGMFFWRKTKQIIERSIAGSYVSYNHLQKKYPIPSHKKSFSISSIRLDSESFNNKSSKTTFNSITIIHVGSFVGVKNQKLLIELIKQIKEAGYEAQLTLVGSGSTQAECIKMAKTLGVADNITFTGQVTGSREIASLLSQHQFFILPSLSEGMPRALIEAMACGLICFGSDRGGIKELLENEFTFNPSKAENIFFKLLDYYNRPDKLEAIREKNVKTAAKFKQKLLRQRRIRLLNILHSHVKEKNACRP